MANKATFFRQSRNSMSARVLIANAEAPLQHRLYRWLLLHTIKELTRRVIKPLFSALLMLLFVSQVYGQTKIGGTLSSTNPGASIELGKTNQGLLLNRVSIGSTTTWGLAGTAAAGMLVYNTNATTTGSATYPVLTGGIGIYYYDGSGWVGITPGKGQFWGLTGNSGTVDGTNFLGTTDNIPLSFRVNNIASGRLDPALRTAFFGYQAGLNNKGGFNTYIGYGAAQANTTGSGSVAVGYNALNANVTGFNLVAIGSLALSSDTTANNMAVGFHAGAANTSGTLNHFVGNSAGTVNVSGSNNFFEGYESGLVNVAGSNNHFEGFQTGANNTASNNTFIGYEAGLSNTTGTPNTFIGYQAGYSTSAGSQNTFIGYKAGTNTTSSSSTFIGYQAGGGNSTGGGTFIGVSAGFNNTSGVGVFIGNSAGFANTSGGNSGGGNDFVGDQAGSSNTTGSNNAFFGENAGWFYSTGSNNTAVGNFAGSNGSSAPGSGNNNVYVGANSAAAVTTAANNIVIGDGAGSGLTQGANNVIIGYQASNISTGGNNIIIGATQKVPAGSVTASNQMNIGGFVFGTGMSGTANSPAGSLGIATPAPTALVDIVADNNGNGSTNDFYFSGYGTSIAPSMYLGSARGTRATPTNLQNGDALGGYFFNIYANGAFNYTNGSGIQAFYKGNGTTVLSDIRLRTSNNDRLTVDENGNVGIGLTGPTQPLQMASGAFVTAAGVWTNASDTRLKKDIIDSRYGLKEVMRLRPVTYVMKSDGEKQVGFIAQDVKKIIPELVSGKEGDISKGETLGLSYGNMVAVLTKAMQQQQKMIDELKVKADKMDGLEKQVKIQQKEIDDLKALITNK